MNPASGGKFAFNDHITHTRYDGIMQAWAGDRAAPVKLLDQLARCSDSHCLVHFELPIRPEAQFLTIISIDLVLSVRKQNSACSMLAC